MRAIWRYCAARSKRPSSCWAVPLLRSRVSITRLLASWSALSLQSAFPGPQSRISRSSISARLALQLERTLARGKQAVLFLNRRGYSSFLLCRSCGDVPECPNCSVSLTHYRRGNSLQCHYCGYEAPRPPRCAKCSSDDLGYGGLGTESLELELTERFPKARIVRIDRETTQKRG